MTASILKNEIEVRHNIRPDVGKEFITFDIPNGWDDVKGLVRKFLFTIIRSSVSPVGIPITIIVYLPSLSVRKSRRQNLINKFPNGFPDLKSN